ncbi:MAG: ribonuclease Y [Planctomycetes bacterium]|nr:ribonuclease Y [Planctomycetota bacterium]
MDPQTEKIIFAVAGVLAGALGFYIITFLIRQVSRRKANTILEEAKAEAEKFKKAELLVAKEEVYKLKESFERETQETRQEIKNQERRLLKHEDALDRKADLIQRREKSLEAQEKNIEQKGREAEEKRVELSQLVENEKRTVHTISGLNKEEATKQLLGRLENEMQTEMVSLINKMREQTKENVEVEAKKQIALAIQRIASNHTAEITVSTVDLPNDEMKGRVIGREGRNIRTFEKVTGVDVIVDDTPGVIVISAFDGVRREVARRAMEKLVLDGRIHPGRIEEIIEQTKKEVESVIMQTGKQACYDLNVHGLNQKLVNLLGRLKYRTSYGQNVLEHSIEVAWLASAMATELKLDTNLAKRCGLLHDIGKAIDQEMEGTHPSIGAELARRFEERPEVVDSIERHHDTANPEFIYTVLVSAADAISAARPGARRESMETYVKRLERLENISNSYSGVENSYAIQAGREIRVIVNAEKIDDKQATIVARNIANDIEKELKYPGEIKVTVIRETRVTEYAR